MKENIKKNLRGVCLGFLLLQYVCGQGRVCLCLCVCDCVCVIVCVCVCCVCMTGLRQQCGVVKVLGP